MRVECGMPAAISWTSLSWAGRSAIGLLLQQFCHRRDDRLQRLQRSQHDLERYDLLVVVPVDHVDPIDVDAVDRRGELKDRGPLLVPLLDVVKVTIAEHLCGCLEVHRSLFSAFLRGEHRGGEEHCVIGEQGLQVDGAAALDDRDPASNYGWRHTTILADSAQRATSATRPDAGAVASPSWRTSKPRTASPSGCR